MAHGGRAFIKPLPFALGTNGSAVRYGFGSTDLSIASGIGIQWYRNDIPWTVGQGGTTPIESSPGAYSSSNLTQIQTIASQVKAAGLKNLFVVTVNQNPGLCPTLNSPLTSGSVYTSITVTALPFAITSGQSIVLTNPANQSQTQTITAGANMSAGASGSLTVSSFTANHNYADGAWVYDTSWVACTPQHFANLMSYLVSQTGLQGLTWELFNEPDGESWGITPTLITQAYQLAYPAMKAADPTCTVLGPCTESLAPPGNYIGIDYYNLCVTAGILGYYDVCSAHEYRTGASSGVKDCAPDALDSSGNYAFWQAIAAFQANRVSKGDATPLWITEYGWQYTSVGQMTPQFQAQFYQNLLATLSGKDPINNVLFSSYLKVMFNYDLGGAASDDYWGIAPNDVAGPAVAVLTEMVTGH